MSCPMSVEMRACPSAFPILSPSSRVARERTFKKIKVTTGMNGKKVLRPSGRNQDGITTMKQNTFLAHQIKNQSYG